MNAYPWVPDGGEETVLFPPNYLLRCLSKERGRETVETLNKQRRLSLNDTDEK